MPTEPFREKGTKYFPRRKIILLKRTNYSDSTIFVKRKSICLSVCLFARLSVFLSFCLSVCQAFCLSVFLSFCLSVFLSVFQFLRRKIILLKRTNYSDSMIFVKRKSICLSVCLSLSQSVILPVCLLVIHFLCFCLTVYLSIYVFVFLSKNNSNLTAPHLTSPHLTLPKLS